MMKYYTTRILFLIGFLIATHYIYNHFLFEKDLLRHSEVVNLVREVDKNTEILYIGESSNSSSHSEDIDKRKISEFISDFYPNMVVDDITKPAAHARNYYHLLKQIPESNQIKTLIVTLNLRSFGIGWIESDLETSLNKSMVLLEEGPPLYNRFRLAFKAYNDKTKKERMASVKKHWKKDIIQFPEPFEHNTVRRWDGHLFKTGIRNADGSRNEASTQLACHFVKNYGFNIDTLSNPRIQDFNNIIDLAKENNWNVVFNLLAENTERGSELVGENWTYLMNTNANILVDYFTSRGALVVNNLHEVPDSLYTDRNWTTEHYHEEGRQTIATHVAKSIKHLHSNQFKNHDYLSAEEIFASTNHYQHNMEKVKGWTGEHFTTEKAKSGSKSCKINTNNLYSTTLEIPYNKLGEDYKGIIDYSMQILAANANFNTSLIIEMHHSKQGNKNLVYTLSPEEITNQWTDLSHRFTIPKEYFDSELIKVFVYNPSSTDIYIDDVNIIFETY